MLIDSQPFIFFDVFTITKNAISGNTSVHAIHLEGRQARHLYHSLFDLAVLLLL